MTNIVKFYSPASTNLKDVKKFRYHTVNDLGGTLHHYEIRGPVKSESGEITVLDHWVSVAPENVKYKYILMPQITIDQEGNEVESFERMESRDDTEYRCLVSLDVELAE